MNIKDLNRALDQIAAERKIPKEKIHETLEAAIAAAYKKDYGKKGQKIRARFDLKTGKVKFWQEKLVVDESMVYSKEELRKMKKKPDKISKDEGVEKKIVFNSDKHIMIEEARKINPEVKLNEEIEIPLREEENYGRIAAQTAKQVILQKIREIEKETILSEYKSKEGEIISGIIQQVDKSAVFVDIGRTLGILRKKDQTPGEFYRPGQRMKFYILKTEENPKGPVVYLSRSHPKLISKLFELEVPEIASGIVQIKTIAREPGIRTKIAVESKEEGVDAIGALVGQRGTRILAVTNELGGEKIDVIEYQQEAEKFIANALSPAKILEVKIGRKNTAQVLVDEDQFSLAIGKNGSNVRLAANLTNWKIDIKSLKGKEKKFEEENKEKKVEN